MDSKCSSQAFRKNLFKDIVYRDPQICKTDYVVRFQLQGMWLLALVYHVYTDSVLKNN